MSDSIVIKKEDVNEFIENFTTLKDEISKVVIGHRDLTENTVCPGLNIKPMFLGPNFGVS